MFPASCSSGRFRLRVASPHGRAFEAPASAGCRRECNTPCASRPRRSTTRRPLQSWPAQTPPQRTFSRTGMSNRSMNSWRDRKLDIWPAGVDRETECSHQRLDSSAIPPASDPLARCRAANIPPAVTDCSAAQSAPPDPATVRCEDLLDGRLDLGVIGGGGFVEFPPPRVRGPIASRRKIPNPSAPITPGQHHREQYCARPDISQRKLIEIVWTLCGR